MGNLFGHNNVLLGPFRYTYVLAGSALENRNERDEEKKRGGIPSSSPVDVVACVTCSNYLTHFPSAFAFRHVCVCVCVCTYVRTYVSAYVCGFFPKKPRIEFVFSQLQSEAAAATKSNCFLFGPCHE